MSAPADSSSNSNRRNNHNRNNYNRRQGNGNASNRPKNINNRNSHKNEPREINMSSYGKMINQIKENFADIKQTGEAREDCTICCKEADLFGLGNCRHPVCVECTIRMRVLGEQKICPVCRAELDKCYLMFSASGLATVPLTIAKIGHSAEARYGIRFQNADARIRYDQYLSHSCKKCKNEDGSRVEFPTFSALRQHMISVHQLSYCPICTENIRTFSRERKTYNKEELKKHTRMGDGDYQSQKGHPECLFCPMRFYDEEARYRHLRRDHFFCQFCEDSGLNNIFFKNHGELIMHYKKEHYICEEPNCKEAGIAFANEFDLNVHKSREHTSKKTFQLFNSSVDRVRNPRGRPPPTENVPAPNVAPAPPPPPAREVVVVRSAQSSGASLVGRSRFTGMEDFPSLPGAPSSNQRVVVPSEFPRLAKVGRPNQQPAKPKTPAPAATPVEEFPTLGGSSSRGGPSNSQPHLENWRRHTGAFDVIDDDERALSVSHMRSAAASTSSRPVQQQKPVVQKKVPQKPVQPVQPTDDFPALPMSSGLGNNSNWAAKAKKTAITGLKMPNKKKNLPVPDMWPDSKSSSASKPYEPPPPEEWKEIPVTKKLTKKERKEQQKKKQDAVVKEAEQQAEEEAAEFQRKMLEPPDEDLEMQAILMRDIRASTSESKNEKKSEEGGSLPKNKKNKNKNKPEPEQTKLAEAEKPKTENVIKKTVNENSNNKNNVKNGYINKKPELKQMDDDQTEQTEAGITSWLKSSVSSMFSGLSLSNILGDSSAPLSSLPSTPVNQQKNDFSVETPMSAYRTPPPGLDSFKKPSANLTNFSTPSAPPPSAVVYTAPPGFEDVQPTGGPPGFDDGKSAQLFSMAPFISHNDVKRVSANEPKREPEAIDGWVTKKR